MICVLGGFWFPDPGPVYLYMCSRMHACLCVYRCLYARARKVLHQRRICYIYITAPVWGPPVPPGMLIRIHLHGIYIYIYVLHCWWRSDVCACHQSCRLNSASFRSIRTPPVHRPTISGQRPNYVPSALSVVILAQVVCSGSSWAGASAWDWQWRRLPCGRHGFDNYHHHHSPCLTTSTTNTNPTPGMDASIIVTCALVINNWRMTTCVRTSI